jgi:uncharacterized membrane protein (DUF2068 family)
METKVLNLQGLGSVFTLLKYTFFIVPVVAGIDKFLYLLTDWDKYINPTFLAMLPFPGTVFMKIVGVIEIAAGILVLLRPSFGGLLVAVWLSLIALQLIAGGIYLDVAVRDIVMAISSFSMAKLAYLTHQ